MRAGVSKWTPEGGQPVFMFHPDHKPEHEKLRVFWPCFTEAEARRIFEGLKRIFEAEAG